MISNEGAQPDVEAESKDHILIPALIPITELMNIDKQEKRQGRKIYDKER